MHSFTRFGLLLIPLIVLISACSKSPDRPNILLFTLDTLRADAVGCYGNAQIKTPNLDKLAQEGVIFKDAMCQIPATLTSHTAIMTGRNPKTTGVRFRTGHVPAFEETLAERFKSYGYQTAAFISSSVLAPEFGLNQGFDKYEMGTLVKQEGKSNFERKAQETIDQAISFVHKTNKPFFIWVHLYDPHTPYAAPAPYSTMYDAEYQGSMRGGVKEITRLNAFHGKGASPRDLRHIRALYDGEVTYMDHQIGRLIAVLEEKNVLDKTVIAAMADHGENLGEGGRFFHGDDLYQPATHIPFIMRYPEQIKQGAQVSRLVQSIDLFPTLMEITDIPMISGIEGASLLPLIAREENTTPDIKPGFLETETDPSIKGNKLFGLRTEMHKYIYNAARRRSDVPLGVFCEIPLKGPSLVMLRIKGDESIRLMAHIRYRTKSLYQSRDFQALAQLNTTMVHAETPGVESLQKEAMQQNNFLPTPDGWRLQMTPDIYRIARNYGITNGWPVDWMVLEGVGVDASLPTNQKSGSFTIDQIEFYAPKLRFRKSPRYRNPFWVLEDFEGASKGLQDAGQGAPHSLKTQFPHEELFVGRRQQNITITFNDSPDGIDELYNLKTDAVEQKNLVITNPVSEPDQQIINNSRLLLDAWIKRESGDMDIMELDTSQLEALQALGYTK